MSDDDMLFVPPPPSRPASPAKQKTRQNPTPDQICAVAISSHLRQYSACVDFLPISTPFFFFFPLDHQTHNRFSRPANGA